MRKLILFIVLLSVAGCLYLLAQNTPAKKNYIGFNTVPLWENLAKKDTFSPFTIIYERMLNKNRVLVVESDLYFNHKHTNDGWTFEPTQLYKTWINVGVNIGYYYTRVFKRFSYAYGVGAGYKVDSYNLKADNYASGIADGKEFHVYFDQHYQTMSFSFYPSLRLQIQLSENIRMETEAKLPFQYKLIRFWGIAEDRFLDGTVNKNKYLEPFDKSLKIGVIPIGSVNLMFNF